jgi:hypothetical protein
LRPDIFVKGGDYTIETLPEASLVEALGGAVQILPYVEDRSTSNIIERIRREKRANLGQRPVPPRGKGETRSLPSSRIAGDWPSPSAASLNTGSGGYEGMRTSGEAPLSAQPTTGFGAEAAGDGGGAA